MRLFPIHLTATGAGLLACLAPAVADNFSDTWVATDALGRTLPGFQECGPPRSGRHVGMFYFLWLGAHVVGGPHDVTRILAQHPGAMDNPASPPWGPLHAMHHWGESAFGYYDTRDPWVLRKHAQMLADAGVDVIIFDVTNQFTYRSNYLALLKAFAAARQDGNQTPQIAFLCPFWDPPRVVRELYRDFYQPGLHLDLWFRWQGKPLILADPDRLETAEEHARQDTPGQLTPGRTLGQTFVAAQPFVAVAGRFPTFHTTNSGVTLSLFKESPAGPRILQKTFSNVVDNDWLALRAPSVLSTGTYYLEASAPIGTIGWWSHTKDHYNRGQSFSDGKPAAGDRTLRIHYADPQVAEIRRFFTFRAPQPDYFRGPVKPDMWSWLEIHPQHVFTNTQGQAEQMSVGVAQNAVSNRLGSMSEPGALGRSYHNGAQDNAPDAVLHGYNFAEQFQHALKVDPQFIFITGWNEWIAGRYNEFSGIHRPVMFVDQFDQEHSRDIEPMRGGHGDNYYYQMASSVRRYKGVRATEPSSPAAKTIAIRGSLAQWADVKPEFLDDRGDTLHRDYPGYNNFQRYTNYTGRNDFVALKAAADAANVYFYARTREPITGPRDALWMRLYIDADSDHHTGWEGYDLTVAAAPGRPAVSLLQRRKPKGAWETVAEIPSQTEGAEFHCAIPRSWLAPTSGKSLEFAFKWTDNIAESGGFLALLADGDAAPNARFNYRYTQPKKRQGEARP